MTRPFDPTPEERAATSDLLREAQALLDRDYRPRGYTVGRNRGQVGGQEIFHAHLHVIPRYEDEPFAGRGRRSWLNSAENARPSRQHTVAGFPGTEESRKQ